MLTWEPAPSSHETPGRDAYSLRLVTGKTLYDHGRTASRSAVFHDLAGEPMLLVSAGTLSRLGVTNGTTVRAATTRGSITVPVKAVRGMPDGVARLATSAGPDGVRLLIDADTRVTDVRVETLS